MILRLDTDWTVCLYPILRINEHNGLITNHNEYNETLLWTVGLYLILSSVVKFPRTSCQVKLSTIYTSIIIWKSNVYFKKTIKNYNLFTDWIFVFI